MGYEMGTLTKNKLLLTLNITDNFVVHFYAGVSNKVNINIFKESQRGVVLLTL